MNGPKLLTLVFAALAILQTATAQAQWGTRANRAMQTEQLQFQSRARQSMGVMPLAQPPSQADVLRAIHQNRQRSQRVRMVVQNLYGGQSWTNNNSRSAMGVVQMAAQTSQTDVLRAIHERQQRDQRVREVVRNLYGNNQNQGHDSSSAMGSKTLSDQGTTYRLIAPSLPEQQQTVKLFAPPLPEEQQQIVRLIAPSVPENDNDNDDN